jgi:anti-sigma B factor antagonist
MSQAFRIEDGPGTAELAVVRVHGELDPRSAPALAAHCRVFAHDGRGLVLNLSGVTFLSSSGMGAVLALVSEFRQKGLPVKLAEISPAAESVIRVLNLDQFLTLEKTEADALHRRSA